MCHVLLVSSASYLYFVHITIHTFRFDTRRCCREGEHRVPVCNACECLEVIGMRVDVESRIQIAGRLSVIKTAIESRHNKDSLISPRQPQTAPFVVSKVECLLTLAIWCYGHEAEEYIFLNLPFPSNPKEILQFVVF